MWGARVLNSCAHQGLGRSSFSVLHTQDAVETVAANGSRELRVGVLGLGAIGSIFFTRLGRLATSSKTKKELPMLHVDAFIKFQQFGDWKKKSQFALHSDEEKETLEFQVTSDEVAVAVDAPNVRVRTLEKGGDDEKLDVLLVAVKAYDSTEVVRELRERHKPLLKDDALYVLLQNGLGEVPQGLSGVDGWTFVNGVTFVGGRVLGFGNVLVSGLDAGVTYLAPLAGLEENQRDQDGKIKTLAEVFLAAGINCEVLEAGKIQAMLWRKLIVNAAINPLASLLDAPNKSVVKSEGSRHCVNLVVQEALAVAKSEQIPMSCSQSELVEEVLEVARNTGTNVCSMLADLRRGSRTEIDAITGRIVAGGKRHGIPTPTNDLLLSLIQALEAAGTRQRD